MLKKTIIFTLLFFSLTFAKKSEKDTLYYAWIPTMVAGLNISQVSFTNWAKSGTNTLSWIGTFDFGLRYKTYGWSLKNEFKSAFGRTKVGSEDFRTNENELYNETVYSVHIDWEVDPYISNTVRTQITRGYDYKKDPPEPISDFWDPGYVTQSIGFTYDKKKVFQSRMGIAIQETWTNEFNKYSDNPETKDEVEDFRFETGIESVTDLNLEVDENVVYKSKLRLFGTFEHIDVWDVRWDNTFSAKVNSWLNVNLSALLMYEKAQSPKTQLKQMLQLGIVYNIM